jgi:hypothetical protein
MIVRSATPSAILIEDLLDPVGDLDRRVEAAALRAVDRHVDAAAVLGGHQFLRQQGEQTAGAERQDQHRQAGDQGGRALAQQAFQRVAIAVLQRVHGLVHPARQPVGAGRLEQLGGHHRRQAQRQQRREAHGGGDGHGQLDEQPADIAGQEHQRREHRDQHDGGGHHREEHLSGAAQGRHGRRLALVDTALDVLDHDDGVVDHQADGQHQGQQGQQVQREAQRGQHDEGRQDADRRDDRRDQSRAPAAQEQQVDQGDQGDRDAHGDPHLVDRLGGEHRVVDRHDHLGPGRQGLVDRLDFLADGLRDRDVIGLRLAGQGDADLVDAIAPEQLAAFVRALLHSRHVAQADHEAVGVAAAQGQLQEVLGLGIGAADPDREVLGRAFQRAGGQFHVLGVQRVLDVVDRHAARGHGVGVQPDAHGVQRRAIEVGLGHAGDRRHPLDQIAVGVVGQLQGAERAGGQVQDDDRRGVGVGLGDLGRVGLVGQVRRHPADRVAHVVGGRVEVAVQGEGDGDLRTAVARGAVDAVDALDPGDLALDDLGDPLLDDLGRGAAIGGRDRHHRRIDARQLADRQALEGGQADDAEDDRGDRGEDRPANGKVGKHQPAFCLRSPWPA